MCQFCENVQKKKYQKPLMDVVLVKANGTLLLGQSMDVIIEKSS